MSDWVASRWWRVMDADGRMWCETSDEKEARRALRDVPNKPGKLQQMFTQTTTVVEWRCPIGEHKYNHGECVGCGVSR